MSDVPFDDGKSNKDPLDSFFENSGPQWEEVQLPSKGLYYGDRPWSKVGIPGGIIQVKPWTINEEKILNTTRFVKTHKALDMIFDKTCKLPEGFNPDDMLVGDRAFLLYYFRGISYGNLYEFNVKCTNEDCGVTSPHEYDLNNLAGSVVMADESLGDEPFDVELPDATKRAGGKITAQVRFSRQKDVKSMMRSMNQNRTQRGDNPDDSLTRELVQNIVSINNKPDRMMIKRFVDKMSALDASVIRDFLKNNTPTIKPEVTVECPHCSNVMEMELPITETFFRFTGASNDREYVE